MAKKHEVEKQEVSLNLTSMMDIVFQLIIFFLLVTNFTSAELPELEPPDLEHSEAIEIDGRDKLVINIIPDSSTGMAKAVQVGMQKIPPGAYNQLTDIVSQVKTDRPDVEIDLRADASINYENVQPVMNAITAAGVARINLVAYLDASNPKREKRE
ncbi:biopolymer transporter ExbD [Planctomycetales bacterium ZRK34]|nr:biopolymer transporter ExbD [Planctomycetales bacterium ZRK34]